MGTLLLVKVSAGKGQGYVQLDLDEIDRITVNTLRTNNNEIKMKDGTRHILQPEEAQRVVDAMRKADNNKLGLL